MQDEALNPTGTLTGKTTETMPPRIFSKVFSVFIFLAGLASGLHQFTAPARASVSPEDLHVPPGIRVMIFSPHPDDETLAAGGIIQRAAALGGEVRIVWITNGDGYLEGMQKEKLQGLPSSQDFINYGMKRHKEALEALRSLGLRNSNGVFLGFPDDGIQDLWFTHWPAQHPYRSPHTHLDHVFYDHTRNRWARYTGEALKHDIMETLMDFEPDWVVVPDPRDVHPDHRATGYFVLDALNTVLSKGRLHSGKTSVFTYLVHYADYPSASQWEKHISEGEKGMSSSSPQLDGTWWSLVLTEREIQGKQRALKAHASQWEALGGFLQKFVQHRELFCRLDTGDLKTFARELHLKAVMQGS